MTTACPVAIGRVVLTVRDLVRTGDFYQRVIGLHRLAGDEAGLSLGAGSRPLLELRRDAAARVRSPREAGLFHTAFLLPGRADLGRWLRQAAAAGVPLSGAADHAVSEALYLADPEGNGIEVYADRPASAWRWREGQVEMINAPLDLEALARAGGDAEWQGMPEGGGIGHVHLQVGALAPAEAFYAGRLGLDVTCRYPGASFFAAGGYHHHLAANIWNSRGAPPRDLPSTGLAEVELRCDPAFLAAASPRGAVTLADPWGTPVLLAPR